VKSNASQYDQVEDFLGGKCARVIIVVQSARVADFCGNSTLLPS